MKRRVLLQGAAGAALLAGGAAPAMAQSRAETLRYVTGATINTLDTTMFGATRELFGLSMNVYDRLFRLGRKKVADYWVFDPGQDRRRAGEVLQHQPGQQGDHHHLARLTRRGRTARRRRPRTRSGRSIAPCRPSRWRRRNSPPGR